MNRRELLTRIGLAVAAGLGAKTLQPESRVVGWDLDDVYVSAHNYSFIMRTPFGFDKLNEGIR